MRFKFSHIPSGFLQLMLVNTTDAMHVQQVSTGRPVALAEL